MNHRIVKSNDNSIVQCDMHIHWFKKAKFEYNEKYYAICDNFKKHGDTWTYFVTRST